MKRAVLLAAALAAGASPGCRERGRPDPDIHMAVSHDREDPSGSEDLAGSVPSRLVVPPEVVAAYSGIRVAWRDASSGKEGEIEVPLAGTAAIPGSSLEVRADTYLPAFTMSSDVITSSGIDPENPAARVVVSEEGRQLFAGWIFTRFPDVHPFTHGRFAIRLEGGVRREKP